MHITRKKLPLTSMLINVGEIIKPCLFLQFSNKNETNNYKLKINDKIKNLCVK